MLTNPSKIMATPLKPWERGASGTATRSVGAQDQTTPFNFSRTPASSSSNLATTTNARTTVSTASAASTGPTVPPRTTTSSGKFICVKYVLALVLFLEHSCISHYVNYYFMLVVQF